ncbi:MAG: sensor domain-containing diguanylate cyclase [Candidatus Nanopelagicales bacterium]
MRRRHVLRIPVVYLLLILFAGFGITALLLRYDIGEDVNQATLISAETSQSLSNAIYQAVATYYTPTVAGEGFVEATVDQSNALDIAQSGLLDAGFAPFAAPLVDKLGDALLDYQLAPAGIVTYSARPVENAAALGHNLLADDARRDDIIATVEARSPIITGPLNLKQGGTGIIIRQAIFAPGLAPFADRYRDLTGAAPDPAWADRIPDDFWGFSTTVVDAPAMLAALGESSTDPATFALRKVNADGTVGESFIGAWNGDPADAEVRNIELPDGSTWRLFVAVSVPPPLHHWPVLLIGLLSTFGAAALAAWAYHASARYRLGYNYSHAVIELTSRDSVLQSTADYLATVYPQLSGQIEGTPEDRLAVPIGTGIPAGNAGASSGRVWDLMRAGRRQARITLDDTSIRAAADINEVLETISPMLAATLGSLQQLEHASHDSVIDHLTEVFNRRRFQPTFDELSVSVARHGNWLGVAIVDIDEFKALNDTFGHQFGDEALRRLGRALSDSIRGTDSVYRFGGDEFVLLVVVDTEEDALRLLHRVHGRANAVLGDVLPMGGSCTVSIGLRCLSGDTLEPMNEMLSKADQALYRAKATGRDRIEVWEPSMSTSAPSRRIGDSQTTDEDP